MAATAEGPAIVEGQVDFEGNEAGPGMPPLDEVQIEGLEQLSIFDLGGKRATSATIKFTGGKVSLLEGTAFKKGTVITATITAVVNDVGQKDVHDPKTGLVVSAEQRHGARIVDVAVSQAD